MAVLKKCSEGWRQYDLARAAGLHPSVFSAVLRGIRPIGYGDKRVLAIARVVGLDADAAFDLADGDGESRQ